MCALCIPLLFFLTAATPLSTSFTPPRLRTRLPTVCARPPAPLSPPPQSGKSGGSMLQQALLLLSAGAMTGPILPILFLCFTLMAHGWTRAVHELSSRRRYTIHSPVHTFEEEEDGGGGEGWAGLQPSAGSAAVVAAPPRPDGFSAGGAGSAGSAGAGPLDAAALAARLQELRDRRGVPE